MKLDIKQALKTNLLRLLLSTTLAVLAVSYAMAEDGVKHWNPPVSRGDVKCFGSSAKRVGKKRQIIP